MAFQEYVRSLPELDLRGSPSLSYRLHIDVPLLLMLLMVCLGGLVVLYSASGGSAVMVEKQAMRFGLAYIIMLVIAQMDPRVYARWGLGVYVVGNALLVAVLIMGKSGKGAQRWLDLPGLPAFQPSEIMKLAVPIVLAWYLSRNPLPPKLKHLFFGGVGLLIPTALIVQQPDLGTSLLIMISGIFVIYLAGISWKLIASFVSLAMAMGPVMWFFVMREYQKQRVLTFLNPESDPLGAGWNIIQSKTAIGSGGIEGKGFMLGTQSQLDFLPESHTDFIIAVLGEEFGYIGVMLLITLYLAITVRGMIITVRARDSFGRLLAGSITLTFFIYVFVNIGMVSGILPVVGVPLPLISYGGTSIVTLMTGFGILMSISTHQKL
ncbi:rod shape-determining protein RodA [Gynuella sunshinyii]|uniref:Peptidoglycan glycosyltransferase MrdB n=1 Tax=Gynuella sunshinyii YC6258 TaxID=1445510 RepID=A0A0C5V4Q0_9GAMM|nr:rod shape-determining protein RodA [Gynuella sunshinyii]AJQ94465.1 bacterial cell division membrane protein [Gynuella sunshinyii YC6258]